MMLVRAKGVMWGKVRMQIPDWNPFVTIGICIDDLPNVVLDTLPTAKGNHPDFRQNFLANVQGTKKKDIMIDDYIIADAKADEIWQSFLKQAPEGTPIKSSGKSIVQSAFDKLKASTKNKVEGCTCAECNLDNNKGCKCPECITLEQKHEACSCEVCQKTKHSHEFNKPCMCEECNAKFKSATGHKIKYSEWQSMHELYKKQVEGEIQTWKSWCGDCEEYHADHMHKLKDVVHDSVCKCEVCYKTDDTAMEYDIWLDKYRCYVCQDVHANPGACVLEQIPEEPPKAMMTPKGMTVGEGWCEV